MGSKHTLAEYQRSYYQKHKRLGVCVKCGRKAEDGRAQCSVCLGKERDRAKALHALFCGECERPIKFAEKFGRRLHKLCAQKRQARRAPSQHRSAALAYQKRHKRWVFAHGWDQVLQYDNLGNMQIEWHARFALNSLEPSIN